LEKKAQVINESTSHLFFSFPTANLPSHRIDDGGVARSRVVCAWCDKKKILRSLFAFFEQQKEEEEECRRGERRRSRRRRQRRT